MNTQPERTWWQRNFKWVLTAVALTAILMFTGFVFAIFKFATGMIRSSEPYSVSLARAQSHPDVVAVLGTPIEPGWLPNGSIKIENRSGSADLGISLTGPRGQAMVAVVATRRAGVWHYELMQVQAGGNTIDLRTPEERAAAED